MQPMGSKLEASIAIEGKFSEEGLLAMTQGEDMATAMAKALVDGPDAEGAEPIWSKLNPRRAFGHAEERPPAGMLFRIDPKSFVKKARPRRRRRQPTLPSNMRQLSLFEQ